jgi:hypothetical protein
MQDEYFVDGLQLLKALYEENEVELQPFDRFEKWVNEELISGHRVSPRQARRAGNWCGFSIMVPGSKRVLDRYVNDYPIY